MNLRVGEKIGKFELLHSIGEGGMGEVWVGRLRSLGGFESYVAIKVIHGRFAQDKRFRDMFLDEARVSAMITHPNVVSTQDLGVEGQMLYQVMEYVDGDSLASLQADMEERHERMPLPVALRIAAEVCSGLHAAHELCLPDGRPANLVHRDVSPQNILLGANGSVKLIDFGVALMEDRLAQDSQGSLKGKLRYMPQEQASGEKVDRRADIYAIGAVLYEMISGRLPFDDRTEALYFRSLIQGDPPIPLPDDVPDEVRAIVSKAMSVDRNQRYATAEQMAEELFALLRKRPANTASFVEIHLSAPSRRRREVVRSSAKSGQFSAAAAMSSSASGDSSPTALTAQAPEPDTTLEPRAIPPSHPNLRQNVVLSGSTSAQADAFGDTVPPPPAEPTSENPQLTADLPEVPSLSLELGPRGSAPKSAPTGKAAPVKSPQVAPVMAQSSLPARAPATPQELAQPTSRTTTLLEPTRRAGSPAVTGTHDRGTMLGDRPLVTDDEAAAKSKRAVRSALGTVFSLAVVLGAIVLALPTIAKRRVISLAAERGIELEIERVGIGLAGIELSEVHAKGEGLPLKTATMATVRIATSGKVTVNGLEATLDGPAADLPAALAKLGSGKSAFELDVTDGRLTWDAPFGKDTSMEARDLRFAFTREEASDDVSNVTAYVPEVSVTTARGKAGPFTLNVDESEGRKRARLVLAPRTSEGPNVFVIFGGAASPTHVTVRVPKAKLSSLHVPPAYLGLAAGDDPEIDLLTNVVIEPEGRLKGDGKGTVYGLALAGSRTKTPLDVEFSLLADPKKPIEISKGVASYGPITADFGGVVAREPVAGEIRFASSPLPCSYFAGAEAKKRLGAVGAVALELFGKAVRVTGTVNVRGTYTFALANLQAAKLKFDVRDTCGVVLFPN